MPHFTLTINLPDDSLTDMVNGYAGPVTNVQAVQDAARQWISSKFKIHAADAVPHCVSGIAHPALKSLVTFNHVEDAEMRSFLANDKLNHSFDYVAARIDTAADALDADDLDEDVPEFVLEQRREALEAAMEGFGQRNRIEVRNALRDFYTA